MKKLFNYILAISAVCAVSCEKKGLENAIPSEPERIYKTISVTIPETKTEMDGLTMRWSAGDKINVIAKTTGNQATFTLKSGDEGKTSAVFEGTIAAADASETVFYAVYPDVNVTVNSDGIMTFASSASGDHRAYYTNGTKAKAVVNGYDSAFAPMFAVGDANLDFTFKFGFALIKIKVNDANIRTIKINTEKDSRLNGRPSYNVSTGATTGVDSAQKSIECQPEGDGTFSTGATDYYYIPVLAGYSSKPIKDSGVVVTFTDTGDNEATKTTQSLLNEYFKAGHIYNFGDPFAPYITSNDVNIASDATGGNVTFTVHNPVTGGVLTAATPTAGQTNTISSFALGAVGDGTVAFTCAANTESSAKKAYVTLTYTYNTSETVTKDVVITQAAAGATESHVRVYYNNTIELIDGVANTGAAYFTHSTNYVALSASVTNGGGIDNYAIPGTSLTATSSLKLDGSGWLKFTTNNTLNTSVTFYYTKRSSGSGTIKITPTGGSSTTYDDVAYGDVKSKTVALAKNTEYTIARDSGELLLIAVVVNETSE